MQSPLAKSTQFEGIVDVYLADSISWWPQTLGWLLLLIAVLFVAAIYVVRWAKNYWADRFRREALSALEAININESTAAKDIFFVVKTVATYLDQSAAPLYGAPFMRYLDSQVASTNKVFNSPLGEKWSAALVDESQPLHTDDVAKLLAYSTSWIVQVPKKDEPIIGVSHD